jgi:hypothetical protein
MSEIILIKILTNFAFYYTIISVINTIIVIRKSNINLKGDYYNEKICMSSMWLRS